MSRTLILWDIDGTIVQSSQEKLFFAYLRSKGHTSLLRSGINLARLAWPELRWYRMKLSYLRGRTVDEVAGWIDDCFEKHIRPALIPESVDTVEALKTAGVRQVLLSGAPTLLAEKTADFLGLDEVIAGVPEIVDQRYTGRMTGPYPRAQQKVVHAERWLDRHSVSWDAVVAVADHYDDRFLLEKAQHAIVVGQDERLHRYAASRSWPVADPVQSPGHLRETLERILQVRLA